jgi:hypothetical protein
MAIVTVDYDSEWLFIGGSMVKAYQHSTGAASCRDEAIVGAWPIIAASCT